MLGIALDEVVEECGEASHLMKLCRQKRGRGNALDDEYDFRGW
jgi:hypothetical protein